MELGGPLRTPNPRSLLVAGGLAALTLAGTLASGCGSGGSSTPAPSASRTTTTTTAAAAAHRAAAPPVGTLAINVRVSPARAGTPAHPQPVTVALDLRVGARRDVDPPTLEALDIAFPAGTSYGGGHLPVCSTEILDRRGPGGCPAGSVMGSGRAIALADTARTQAEVSIVNGGGTRVLFHTSMNSPARVREATEGTVAVPAGAGPRMHVAIPRSLQVVAGLPLYLRSLHLSVGHGDWLATTTCPPGGSWRVSATARFADGSRRRRATSVRCEAP